MSTLQILFIAFIQGLTEPFPISSLGHAVLIPSFFHWHYNPQDPTFLPLLVFLHTGTSLAFLFYFSKDWLMIARGFLGQFGPKLQRESFHIIALLCITTLPAVCIGYFFEKHIRMLFSSTLSVSFFLVINGLLLIGVEKLKQHEKSNLENCISRLSYAKALFIGFCECLAFFPGISRSGASIGGGLLSGLKHEGAALFSFLIAQPIIMAATVRELTKIHFDTQMHFSLPTAFLAAIVAGLTGLYATAFLMKYFKNHDQWALSPFGFYCIVLGLFGVIMHYV